MFGPRRRPTNAINSSAVTKMVEFVNPIAKSQYVSGCSVILVSV